MNKVIIVPALLVAGVLGVGYTVGQIGGVTTTPLPAPSLRPWQRRQPQMGSPRRWRCPGCATH
jgi:hypothetical protein